MKKFNSAAWIKAFKANIIAEKDESINLDDLLHTEPIDGKFDKKPKAKTGEENDLAIEKDKKGRDVYAVGLTEDARFAEAMVQELLDNLDTSMEELIYEWTMEAKRIGGDFGAEEIKQLVIKRVETSMSDWERDKI